VLPRQFVNAVAVTPHDTNANAFDALYIGGAGNVAVVTQGGQSTTFIAPPIGTVLYIKTKQVLATGTTASNLVGLR